MADEYRVTKVSSEVLISGDSDVRVTKVSAEALISSGPSDARVTKVSAEALIRVQPFFKIVDNTIVAIAPIPAGVYPTTIRVTDAEPDTLDKVFNLNITET